MLRDFDRKPPLWVEQGDDIYGHNLTPSEFAAEELDDRPSLRLLRGGLSSSSRCHVNSPGVDQTLSRPSRTLGPSPSPSSATGPNFPEAA